MRGLLAHRPSPAMVVALIALICALTGTAWAALGKNSVGTKQLKKNAVTGAKVKNGSLTAVDFKPGQLPAGPQGKEGVAGKEGKEGPIGPSDLYSNTGAFGTVTAGVAKSTRASVTVPAGNYQVIASQTAQPSGGEAELDCYIYAGTTQQASFYSKLAANTDGVVTGIASVTVTGPTVISDQCAAFTNNVIVPEPKIVALKVGALH